MMRNSWLVQRLKKPVPSGSGLLAALDFSFGGGLRNGGLSDDAMDLIRPLMRFDYMGAAEFEFGAVPEAFQKMAACDLTAFDIRIPLAQVPPHWSIRKADDAPPDGEATIFVLCDRADGPEVIERVSEWARGKERLKESTRITSTLRPHDDWDGDVVGWLELNNGFFFATDRAMYEGVCRLFGVEVTATEGVTA